jgi:hypothetical protein
MPPAGFEHAILSSERPQTHALDRAATGIGHVTIRQDKVAELGNGQGMCNNVWWTAEMKMCKLGRLQTPSNTCTIYWEKYFAFSTLRVSALVDHHQEFYKICRNSLIWFFLFWFNNNDKKNRKSNIIFVRGVSFCLVLLLQESCHVTWTGTCMWCEK